MKVKEKLLDITAQLTCGVVNGRKIRVRPVIKPPWADKRAERGLKVSLDEDASAAEDHGESGSVLSKEQLNDLRKQQGWSHFKDVFMLSSLNKEDVDTLKVNILMSLQKSSFLEGGRGVIPRSNFKWIKIRFIYLFLTNKQLIQSFSSYKAVE